MTIATADIVAFVGMYLWPLFRILAMFAIAPILGARLVPTRVRLGLALAITVVIAPAVPVFDAQSLTLGQSLIVAIQQMLIGFAMGLVLRMVFTALELGAHVIALQMGLGFAELLDPQGGVQVPTLSQFYIMIGTLMFLAFNGHFLVLQLLLESFQTLPIGPIGLGSDSMWALVTWAGTVFQGAVLVALSATVALVSVNVLTGVMTRAVPQFNMFVAFPGILLLGYLVIAVSLMSLESQLMQLLNSAVTLLRAKVIGG